MTNKEFFIATLRDEAPKFVKVLKALPEDKLDFKPGEKARPMGQVAFQLALQPVFIAGIAEKGVPDWGGYREQKEQMKAGAIAALAEKNFADLAARLAKISDEDWENGKALLQGGGSKWETTRHAMAWGFLFDGIHHRGQLTTYLRAVGAKVPAVYGPSADEHFNS